jgi:hypothetical protein
MPPHVLQEDKPRTEDADPLDDPRPQVAFVVDTEPLSGLGERGAWVSGGEDVDRFGCGPVDGGEVAEVRDIRIMVGEDLHRPGGDL